MFDCVSDFQGKLSRVFGVLQLVFAEASETVVSGRSRSRPFHGRMLFNHKENFQLLILASNAPPP